SSDVCSSDLAFRYPLLVDRLPGAAIAEIDAVVAVSRRLRLTMRNGLESRGTPAPGTGPNALVPTMLQLMATRPQNLKGKILLVDDDPGLLRLLSIRLRSEGYEVEAVESAEMALAVLHRFRPDLVITDLRMDKMDGIGLLKELQTRSPGLRVLIITAHG